MAKLVKKRQLTIGYQPRWNSVRRQTLVPSIKLAGNWLAAAGFTPGEMVEIIVESGSISLKCK